MTINVFAGSSLRSFAFDAPTFYQALDKPRSIIAIRETTQLEGERLVGFVMPFHLKED